MPPRQRPRRSQPRRRSRHWRSGTGDWCRKDNALERRGHLLAAFFFARSTRAIFSTPALTRAPTLAATHVPTLAAALTLVLTSLGVTHANAAAPRREAAKVNRRAVAAKPHPRFERATMNTHHEVVQVIRASTRSRSSSTPLPTPSAGPLVRRPASVPTAPNDR